jgi:rhamnosyltransferase
VPFPKVSVIIPVKNEALKIRACIEGILSQTVSVSEIIVIDSGSTDGTVEILNSYPQVKLIAIPGSEFNHGSTRNLGVQKATGDYVLLTVGDARPYNQFWIEELLKGFVDDQVAGVCGQQVVPHEKDKNPVEWFRPVSEPKLTRYQFETTAKFELLSPLEKKNICGWDDVTAMYRRNILLEIPFQKTSYSEDAIWARDAIINGYAIVYNQKARVYHYHLEDADFTYKRSFTTMYFRYKQFGYLYEVPMLTIQSRIRILKALFKAFGINLIQILKWYNYNLNNFNALVDAHRLFMNALQAGETALDVKHAEICGKPPIPLKTK